MQTRSWNLIARLSVLFLVLTPMLGVANAYRPARAGGSLGSACRKRTIRAPWIRRANERCHRRDIRIRPNRSSAGRWRDALS